MHKLTGIALVIFAALNPADGKEAMEGTGHIDYYGYEDNIYLENDHTRVILNVHGGRVLEYAYKGTNAIYLAPGEEGWTAAQEEPWAGPTGGRLDIGPENVIPAHPTLWLGEWSGEIVGPRMARLTSQPDTATGTQLIREFSLDAQTSRLFCKQIIKNVSDQTTEWCHWSRTFAPGNGIVLIPLSPNSRFPDSYIMYGPDAAMNFHPGDPNIRQRDGFLEVLNTPLRPKLGMDSTAGWFAYLMENDLMFVKRYATFPDQVYNEMAGLTISIWYYKDQMCELEPIGPRQRLAPGQWAEFTEEWWLIPQDFPQDRQVDLKAVEELVQTTTRP